MVRPPLWSVVCRLQVCTSTHAIEVLTFTFTVAIGSQSETSACYTRNQAGLNSQYVVCADRYECVKDKEYAVDTTRWFQLPTRMCKSESETVFSRYEFYHNQRTTSDRRDQHSFPTPLQKSGLV